MTLAQGDVWKIPIMVDTVFVSRFVSTDALGAINIVTPVINLVVGLGTMLAAGAMP